MMIKGKYIPNPIGVAMVSPILFLLVIKEMLNWVIETMETAVIFMAIIIGMVWPIGIILYTGYALQKLFG